MNQSQTAEWIPEPGWFFTTNRENKLELTRAALARIEVALHQARDSQIDWEALANNTPVGDPHHYEPVISREVLEALGALSHLRAKLLSGK